MFVFTFLSLQFKFSVHPCMFCQVFLLYINQGLLLNQSITLAALEVKCV